MTIAASLPGSAVIGRKSSKWKQLLLPEIPATRFSCITSGSLRPKLGLCILSVVLVIAVCLLLVPLSPNMEAATVTHKESVEAVTRANQLFNGKILPVMVEANGKDKNLVASPFSLGSVLAMLHAGAGGETAAQLRTTLALPEKDSVVQEGFEDVMNVLKSNENFTLEAANRLYAQSGFALLKSYLDNAAKHFKATAENLDFANSEESRQIINQWVEKQTHDKIKELIPDGAIDSRTRLVLCNAVYFKGNWANQFEKSSTTQADFHVSETETVKVDMMRRSGEYAGGVIKELGCTFLQLPYKGERLHMLLFLSDSPEGFGAMEEKFATFDISGLQMQHKIKHDVSLPKFKLETSHTLSEPLKKIGLTSMFDSGSADFSNLAEKPQGLYVSAVLQKAFIEVNEEGTEAAAATGGIMMMRMAIRTMQFHCDRPFLFAIKDDLTGMVLFTGRVVNPKNN